MSSAPNVSQRAERNCSSCGVRESALSVSFHPCPFCRTAYYCSPRCRVADAISHECPKTISATHNFSRNCYIILSQSLGDVDSHFSVSILEETKKQRLFDGSYARILAAKDRTRAIHAQIEAWNPQIAQHFEEKPPPFSDAPLRVLHSRWELLEKDDMVDYQSFVALSYCWRSPEWQPVADSYQDPQTGGSLPIMRPLWDFLLGLLDSDEEAIWVDQMCIDQKCDIEKRSAIASMGELYASARLVFVAIEDVVLRSDEVVVLMEAFRQVSDEKDWTISTEMARKIFSVLGKIFSARWFRRAWCFHEYHLSKDRVLAIPCKHPLEPGKLSAIGLFNLGEVALRLTYFQNIVVREEHAELIKKIHEFFGGQDYAFSNIIANTFRYSSRDPEDKLSIALSICELDFKIHPEAASSPVAFIHLLILALASGDATILTTRGPKIKFGDGMGKTSWLHPPNETTWSKRHCFPLPRGIVSLSAEHITLDLLCIPHSNFCGPSKHALKRAQHFLESNLAREVRVAFNLQSKDGEYESEPGTLQTLACALDCGLHWIGQAWCRCRNEVADEVGQSFPAVKHLKAAVLRALFHPGASNSPLHDSKPLKSPKASAPVGSSKPTPLEFKRFGRTQFFKRSSALTQSNAHQKKRDAAFRMILCILLFGRYWELGTRVVPGPGSGNVAISDFHLEEVPAAAFRIPTPSEHKLYSAAEYSLHPRATTFLAVPTVLKGERFGLSDRLWLVEPVADGHRGRICWWVREKVGLLGCASIEAEAPYVYLARGVKVVG